MAAIDRRSHQGARSSLFTYCTQALYLSEPAAYSRITAARAARRFPVILNLLTGGDVTLTSITLLVAHLTDDNHEALLQAARHRGQREVEQLVARLDPQPDIPSSVRKVSACAPATNPVLELSAASVSEGEVIAATPTASAKPIFQRAVVAPLSPERYLPKVTLSRDGYEKLMRASALLRHSVPNGDAAAIVERALTVLLEQLEKTKTAATSRPRVTQVRPSRSRHVPAAVKREVWVREAGRCAFVGAHGRCTETAFLECHHVVPFADRGPTTVENIELRCRAHNVYEAERWCGGRERPETTEQSSRA